MQLPASHPALIRQGNVLKLQDVPTQSPGPGALLVALEYVGVCGTDLQILNGARPDTAPILGHEGLGVICAAGPGARMREGERVVFNPVAQLSAGRLLGHNVPGLFQRYIAVDKQAAADGLILPTQACHPPICGALAEPLAAVIYAQEAILRVVPHLRTAVIFGAGPVGLLAAQLFQTLGTQVFLVHPSEARLNTAVRLGLISPAATLPVSEDLPERLLARNGGERCDAALICTTRQGAPLALQHAMAIVANNSCIDLITNYPETAAGLHSFSAESIRAVRAANVCGIPQEGVYLHLELSNRRIAITGHRGTSADHLEKAMNELVARSSIYRKLITHVLSASGAAAAISALANSGQRTLEDTECIKAMIDWTAVT